MKDWLNDKKNLPIIIGITAVVVVAAFAIVYLTMFRDSGGGEPAPPTAGTGYPTAPDMGGAPSPGVPAPSDGTVPPQPGQPEQPTAASPTQEPESGAAADKKVALLPSRPDPFLPLDYKPPKRAQKPPLVLPPIGILVPPKSVDQRARKSVTEEVLPPQPPRRMAGILYNSKIHAILETSGEAIVVKPGDIVENGNVRVDSIEPNRIILSWLRTKKPIPIEVRMSDSFTGESPISTFGSGEFPGPATPPMTPEFGTPRRRPSASPYSGYQRSE